MLLTSEPSLQPPEVNFLMKVNVSGKCWGNIGSLCQCVSKCVVSVSSQGPERCVSFPSGVVRVLGFNLQSSEITISVLNHRLLCNPVLLLFLFFFLFYFLILRESHISQASLSLTSRRWSCTSYHPASTKSVVLSPFGVRTSDILCTR